MERYTIDRQIAATRAGRLLLCTDQITGKQVVVKRMKASWATKRHGVMSVERQIHRHLTSDTQHPHILNLIDDFYSNGFEHLVLEYCAQGELFDVIENMPQGYLDMHMTQTYFAEICDALQFMHQRGIAHCDLSLENILLTANGVLKISDFGLSMEVEKQRRHAVGKTFYMAPEMHTGNAYDPVKTDVWSLGVMLFIMLTGNPPFESSESTDQVMQFLSHRGWEALIQAWDFEDLIPPPLVQLLSNMLEVNPHERWTLSQVLNHEFVKGSDPANESTALADKMATMELASPLLLSNYEV